MVGREIGITTYGRDETNKFSLPAEYIDAVRRAGGIPLLIPPDGTIEAVEMPAHPWLVAVQWHPELTAADDPTQQAIFNALVEAAGKRRKD